MQTSHRKGQLQLLAATITLLCVFPALANAQDASTKVTKGSLQKMYTSYLTKEGYRPEIDRDGDVQFKHEGMHYFVAVSESDPEFFRVVLPNIWRIESENERQKIMVAGDSSNAKSKVSKVFTVRDNVWVSIEVFVAKPEDFQAIFKRSLSALQNGVGNFVRRMRE